MIVYISLYCVNEDVMPNEFDSTDYCKMKRERHVKRMKDNMKENIYQNAWRTQRKWKHGVVKGSTRLATQNNAIQIPLRCKW